MKDLVLNLPALYADHHTTEVKKILKGIEGVRDIFASSAFHQVALKFDPKVVKPEIIEEALKANGYSQMAVDSAFATSVGEKATRHTAVFSGTGDAMSFAETGPSWGDRPLWPCPGFEFHPPDDET